MWHPSTYFFFVFELFVISFAYIKDMPADLRKKAARVVASKCSLAARVDGFHESTDGSVGQQLRENVEGKFDKWLEPPPLKETKALPRPDDAPRKKRGGRRVRKMKEKFAITEMRRQANRLEFGQIGEDVYQTDLGFSVGTMGRKENTGRVRTPAVDKKTQISISKRLQVGNVHFGAAFLIWKHADLLS